MERGHRSLALGLLLGALPAAAAAPATRPDGDPLGGGTQRSSVEALALAHSQFSGDACFSWIDVVAFRSGGPDRPKEDAFTFAFRSPSLWKMRFEARICLPHGPKSTPPCDGEWQSFQHKGETAKPRCLSARSADSAEALAVAEKHGLPPAPADGVRLGLRLVPKAGGLAKQPRLRGRTVWIVESRGQCHAVDAQTVEHLLKVSCAALGWKPE